ncbi:hypothetical protein [Providencia sp. PROV145]|uniref:hypothetical protein n=1 Tax=Providencia sp. PROV145 TaxID=2949855 RepID=UPI00234B9A9C|nr:hypothetical protein [Providencia sp. PROV145]
MNSIQNDYENNSRHYIFDLVRQFTIRQSHCLPNAFVMKVKTSSLSLQSQDLVWSTLESLVDEGIFRKDNGNYFLTELGDQKIYGTPTGGSYSLEARKEIFNLVKTQRLQPGHALSDRAFYQFAMTANLNPNVKNALADELVNMIGEGFFEQTADDRTLLTEKGFSAINTY